MTCSICNQPILPGEPYDGINGEVCHDEPTHCVAATVRNCFRIARKVKQRSEVVTNVAGASSVMDAIQAEYPNVFAKEEGR